MFEKLNYTKKCYLLAFSFLMFLFIGYHFSFIETINLRTEIQEKKDKLNWMKEKENELPLLKSKMMEFEKAYSKNDSSSVRDKLTAFISEYAEEHLCIVTEIPGNTSFRNNDLRVQTNTFTIKGNYKELVVLLFKLETEQKYLSKIMSANFFSIKDIQSKKTNLYLTIVTQSFEQKLS